MTREQVTAELQRVEDNLNQLVVLYHQNTGARDVLRKLLEEEATDGHEEEIIAESGEQQNAHAADDAAGDAREDGPVDQR